MQDYEWLQKAQSLPVFGSARVYHGSEHRPNMVVRNLPDKWSAYCFACKEYAEKRKEYVRIQEEQKAISRETISREISLFNKQAQWLAPMHDIAMFLHTKHMSIDLLRNYNPCWDITRKRLSIEVPSGKLGRDIYGMSKAKWYNYNRDLHYVSLWNSEGIPEVSVLCEDTFSAIKGAHFVPNVEFIAVLGTAMNKHLESWLLHSQPKKVYLMLDGDQAGVDGCARIGRRLQLLGFNVINRSPEIGDPKDQNKEWFIDRLSDIKSIE